jgi:hypothetical protein
MFLLCCKQSRDSTIKRDEVCIHIFHKNSILPFDKYQTKLAQRREEKAVKTRDNCAMVPTVEELIKKKR